MSGWGWIRARRWTAYDAVRRGLGLPMRRSIPLAALAVLVASLVVVNWINRGVWTTESTAGASDEASANTFVPIRIPGNRKDCGLMSLFLIARIAGLQTSLSDLRATLTSGETGTTMLDLKAAATRLGFIAEGMQLTYGQLLEQLARPRTYAVLHFNSDHFAPAVATVGQRVRMLDSALGITDADEDRLSRFAGGWDGKTLVLTAGEDLK